MRSSVRTLTRWPLAAVALLSLAAGCKKGEPIAPYSEPPINQLIRQGAGGNGTTVTATVVAGQSPQPGTGPVPTVEGTPAIINGGSTPIRVSSTAAMQRIFLEALGYEGHWEITLPAGVSAQDLVLTMGDTLPVRSARLVWRTESGGVISGIVQQQVRTIKVGSGDVQVSVAWSGATDVDLWAVSPANDTIYFGNKTGTSGGKLDLDSNAACTLDNTNNENIVWPRNGAPRGTYKVQVRYYSDCGVARTDWVVTAVVAGQSPRTASGSFVGVAANNPPVNALTFTY